MTNFLCNIRMQPLKLNQSYCGYFLFVNFINNRKKSLSVEVDALDAFTNHLVQEKAHKWENMRRKTKSLVSSSTLKINRIYDGPIEDIITDSLSLNGALQENIARNHLEKIMEILKECDQRKLNFNVILNVLSYFAEIGHIEGIEFIQKMYEDINPNALQIYGNFKQYLAKAIWIKGNIPKALLIFSDVYKNHDSLRENIRSILRFLFYNAAQNNSEASMIAISKFSEELANNYQDYVPLMNLWKLCLLSEWYSDQVLAENLLQKNENLLKIVLSEISHIVGLALKYHKTESVYKLLEILLKYDCKTECSIVLISLFDYKVRQRDLFSCSQILKWSTKYNILIPSLQHEKVLQLLLKVKAKETTKKCYLKF